MPTEDVINFIKNNIENSIKEGEELFGTKIDYILIDRKSTRLNSSH